MRFYIESPCIIETDGPILIEPVIDVTALVHSHTPPIESPETPTLNRTVAPFTPRNSKRSHPHQRVCQHCGVLFMGRNNQLFCQPAHKTAFYREQGR